MFYCRTSLGADQWSAAERASEASSAKRVSEPLSEWLITNVPILSGCESQCSAVQTKLKDKNNSLIPQEMDSNVSAGANANVMQWLAKVAKANSTAVSLAVLGCGP